MVGDMFFMHDLRGIFGTQYHRFIMAFYTFSLGDMTIPLHNTEMAFLTSHPSGNIFPVIKIPTFDFNIPFGFDMTRSTTPYSTGNALLLPSRTSLVIVADETVDSLNGEMGSLDELSVAARASKFNPPPQLSQMFSMGESHILIDHIPLEIFDLMTPLLRTVTIINFIMDFLEAFPNNDISQRKLEIFPFPFQMIQNAWFAVTTQASRFVMRGCFPRVDIFLHVVTEAAK
jgi:hypothetical protein